MARKTDELTLEGIQLALREFVHCVAYWHEQQTDPTLTQPLPSAFTEAVECLTRCARERTRHLELIHAAQAYARLHEAAQAYLDGWLLDDTEEAHMKLRWLTVRSLSGAVGLFGSAIKKRVTEAWGERLVENLHRTIPGKQKTRERLIKAAVKELYNQPPQLKLPDWGQITDLARTLQGGPGKEGSAMPTAEAREAVHGFVFPQPPQAMLRAALGALEVPDALRATTLASLLPAPEQTADEATD